MSATLRRVGCSLFGAVVDGFPIHTSSFVAPGSNARRINRLSRSCLFKGVDIKELETHCGFLALASSYWVTIVPVISRVTPNQCWQFIKENGGVSTNCVDHLHLLDQSWKILHRYSSLIIFDCEGDSVESALNGYSVTSIHQNATDGQQVFERGVFKCEIENPDHLVIFSPFK